MTHGVRRTVLPGGLRVVTESVPGVRSAAVGIWVAVGSRDETRPLAGASHFLEHLLFKGTRRRTAFEISAALEAVGGELNAYTTKEYTCYHARVLDTDLPLAVDVLTDLVARSRIAAEDVEGERAVILEEIAMHDDDPEDAAHALVQRVLWPRSTLGRPVLGEVDSVKALTREQLLRYYRRHYRPERSVVAAAGSLDHDHLVRLVRAATQDGGRLRGAGADPVPPRRSGGSPPPTFSGAGSVRRTFEQANLALGVPALRRGDERRFALRVLDTVLGDGASSRLFQEVRERRGLAYSVYSTTATYADTGMLAVQAGCLPQKVDAVVEICRELLDALAAEGPTEAEVARAKGQLRGAFLLGLEDTGSRMTRVANGELLYGRQLGAREVLARIDAVTRDDVARLARELLSAPPALALVGPG